MSKKNPIPTTAKEIHKRFQDAKSCGVFFEYECEHNGEDCVCNTMLHYCPIIPGFIARERLEEEANLPDEDQTFWPVVREDGSPISEHYDFYYDLEDGMHYAVRKPKISS